MYTTTVTGKAVLNGIPEPLAPIRRHPVSGLHHRFNQKIFLTGHHDHIPPRRFMMTAKPAWAMGRNNNSASIPTWRNRAKVKTAIPPENQAHFLSRA